MTGPRQPEYGTNERSLRPDGAELPEAELGSTAQFQAFVAENDEPEQVRERAAQDPDPAPAARAGVDDERDLQFSSPAPRARSLRPTEHELPPAELGSTAQFEAFASGDRSSAAAGDSSSRPATPDVVLPEDHDPTSAELMDQPRSAMVQPSDLPPVNPDNKRNLAIAAAVLVLVVVVVVLLLILT